MKALKFVAATLALVAPVAMAQTSTWKSDPAHSEVDFVVKHLAVSNVHGRFGHVDATLVFDEKDITKSTVNATIDVAGVSTGEVPRDNHLKTDSFFDVAKFTTATFASTIKGVTKPVVLDVEGPSAPITGMDKKPHVGFSASTTLHRSDFGVGATFPPGVVGEDVKITIELDVAKQ
jgi:polyisoprenoid-binding protein YceI